MGLLSETTPACLKTPHLSPLPLPKGRGERTHGGRCALCQRQRRATEMTSLCGIDEILRGGTAKLSRSFARRDTEGSFNRHRGVNFSALDYRRDLVDVLDVFRWVAIHKNHVSQFSRGNDTAVFVHAHY